MTHPTDPVAAMREACANAVRRRASSLHLSKQHNDALEAAKCADLIETLPLPAAPAYDAVREAKERVVEAAKRWSRKPSPAGPRASLSDILDAVDALLAAERAQDAVVGVDPAVGPDRTAKFVIDPATGAAPRETRKLNPATLDGVTLVRNDLLRRTMICSPDLYEAFAAAFPHPEEDAKVDIPDYADLMTIEEWQDALKAGSFVPDDGTGYYATATKMDRRASSFQAAPAWATHVAWFNK